MATAEKHEFLWPKVLTVANALTNRGERRAVLKRFWIFIGKWLLAGGVVSVLLALGETWAVGPAAAWGRFRISWLVIPFAVALIPVTFFTILLLVESAVLVAFGVLFLPSLLFKDEKRWFRILGRIAVVACVAFVAWLVAAVGADVAAGPGPAPPSAASIAVPVVPAAPPPPAPHHDVVGWLMLHPWIAAALAAPWLAVLKKAGDDAYDGMKRLGKHLGKKLVQ